MALSANRKATEELCGDDPVAKYTLLNDAVLYAGAIVAIDSNLEAQPAANTAGFRVVGVAQIKTDNADDGESAKVKSGIFLLDNSSTSPITRAGIGSVCYVEDDETVAGTTSVSIAAGLVHDVDSAGVWVDMTPAALAFARDNAEPVVVVDTGATLTLTAAQCFQGNLLITGSNSSASTITFPTAVSGYGIAIQRANAGAGYDVILTPAAGDTMIGGDAAATATNTVDAVSGILHLKTADATAWVAVSPLAIDNSSWVTT